MTPGTWWPLLVTAVALGLWAWAVVDFSRTDKDDVRTFSPAVWVVVLVLGNVAGAFLWAVFGRPDAPRA